MDQDTATLLTRWGLLNYIDTFANAGVDVGVLRLMQQQELQELIPCTGDRIRFKSNYAIWKKEVDGATSAYSTQENPMNLGSLSDVDSTILLNLDDLMPSNLNNDIAKKTTSLSQNEQNESYITSQLKNLLRQCPDGRAILAFSGNNNGKLDKRCRRQLCRIIIDHEMKDDNDVGITTHKFIAWAQAIATLFPTESQAVYYAPYIKATYSGQRKCASGKLYDLYNNKKKNLRKQSGIHRRASISSCSTASSNSLPTDNFPDTCEEFATVESDLDWLRTGTSSWTVVEDKWKKTAQYRLKELYSGNEGLVCDYMKKFPALKLPQGYRLLENDFNLLFPDKESFLFSNISTYCDNIVNCAKTQLSQIRDKTIREKINNLLSFQGQENKQSAAILLLPLILPSIATSDRRAAKRKKPSKSEVCESFALKVSKDSDIHEAISSLRERLHSEGKTLQPLLVYVGEINTITAVYVAVDDVFYKFNSFLHAVDVAYKIFHSVNAEYPQDSKLVWLFIQVGLYRMNCDNKNKYEVSLYPSLTDMDIPIL